jgi:hypothetical protein
LFSNFPEVFEGGGEVLPSGGFIVEECGGGCGAEFVGKENLVGIDEVVASAAEQLELEGDGTEGEKVGDADGFVGERCGGVWGIEKYRGGGCCSDGGEPLAAIGTGIEDDMFLVAEHVSPFVGHPGFGWCGNEDDAAARIAVLGFGLAKEREGGGLCEESGMPGAGDGIPETGGFGFCEVRGEVFDGVAGDEDADFGEFGAEGHDFGRGGRRCLGRGRRRAGVDCGRRRRKALLKTGSIYRWSGSRLSGVVNENSD